MTERAKVLVVDDEPDIRDLIQTALSEKYNVTTCQNGKDALDIAAILKPHVIVLDVRMPVMDGLETCSILRAQDKTKNSKVIMLTAFDDVDDRIKAFEAGADDYINKPFLLEELLARVESKVKRSHEHVSQAAQEALASQLIVCGNLKMDLLSQSVFIDDTERQMTSLEFNLLKFLLENRGVLKKRDEILAAVWGECETTSRILDPHILSIRRKIVGFDHQIQTVYGGGYIIKANR